MDITFGSFVRNKRLALKQTLREFCLKNGFDAGNFSRLERGLLAPPDDEALLAKYAAALDIKKGAAEWITLFDLAATEKGRLPQDVLENKDLMRKLPVLCRTIASKPLSPEKLDSLIQLIQRS